MMSDPLNPRQRNAVTVALRAFERQLREVDEWIRGREQAGTLYRRGLVLSEERRVLVSTRVVEALSGIAELADRLGLEPQEEDAASTLRAAMSACWATLCDLRSDKLRRYGSISPLLPQMLDPAIEALAAMALSIADSVQDAPLSDQMPDAPDR